MLQGQYRAREKSGMVQQRLDTAYSRMQWVRQSILRIAPCSNCKRWSNKAPSHKNTPWNNTTCFVKSDLDFPCGSNWKRRFANCMNLWSMARFPASLDPNHNKNKSSNTSFLFAGPSPMFLQRDEEPNEEKNPQPAQLQQPPGLAATTTTSNHDASTTTVPTSTPNSNQSPPAATAPPDDDDKNQDDALHLSPSLSVLLQRIQALEERLAHQEQRQRRQHPQTSPQPHSPSSTTTTTQVIPGGDPFADDDHNRSTPIRSANTTTNTNTPMVIPTTGGGQVEEQQQALEERDQWLLALPRPNKSSIVNEKKKQLEQEQGTQPSGWMQDMWKQGKSRLQSMIPEDQTTLSSILGSLSLSSSPMEEDEKKSSNLTTTTTMPTPSSTGEALQPRSSSSSSTHSTDNHHQKDDDGTNRLESKDQDETIDKVTTTTTTTATTPVSNNNNTTNDTPHIAVRGGKCGKRSLLLTATH